MSDQDNERFEFRDGRHTNWWWADNTIMDDYAPRVGAVAIAVYCYLARQSNAATRSCYPSHRRICEALGISRSAVKRAIHALVDTGLVGLETREAPEGDPTSNGYVLLNLSLGGGSSQNPPGPKEGGGSSQDPGVWSDRTHPYMFDQDSIDQEDPSPQAYGSTGGPPPERLRGEPLSKGKAENRPIDAALLAQNSRKTNQDRPTPQPPAQSEQARLLPPALPEDWRAAALELKSRMRTPDLNAVEIQLLAWLHANGVPLEAVVNTVETGLTAAGKIISRLYYFEGPLRDLAAGKQVGNGNGNGGVDRKRSDFERRYDWGPNPPPIARLLPQHGFSPRPPGSEHYPGERPWAKVEELIATGGGAVTVEEWARLRKMGIVAL